jgi:hypothetical protein
MPRGKPKWRIRTVYEAEPVVPSAWENYLNSRRIDEETAVELAPMDSGIRKWVRDHRNRFIPEQVLAVLGERE